MQKKRFILPALIIVLGGIWAGSAWYTGTEIEKNYASTIEKINQNSVAKIENVQLDRHIFSTDMQYQLTVGDDGTIPMHTTIYHGPFPLNLVSHFNLMPTMVSSQTVMPKTQETEDIFAIFNEKDPFLFDLNIGYQQQLQGNFLLNSGKFKSKITTANWGEIQFSFNFDGKKKVKSVINIPLLDFNVTSEYTVPLKYLFEQFNIDADLELTNWKYLPTGKIHSTAKLIQTSENLAPFFEDKNLTVSSKDQVSTTYLIKKGDFYSLQTEGTTGEYHINGLPFFSKQSVNMQLNHFHGNSLVELIDAIRSDNKTMTNQSMMNIWNNQPQIMINPLVFANDAGKSELITNIVPENIDLTKGNKTNFFEQFNFQFTFDKAFQKKFIETLLPLINDKEQDVVKQKQEFEDKLQQLVKEGVFTENDQSYQLHFILKEDEFYLNQQRIPKEVLAFALFGLFAQFDR